MRAIAVLFGASLAICSLVLLSYELETRPDIKPSSFQGLVVQGFDATQLKIPEERFLPTLKEAKDDVKKRYGTASTCRFWSRVSSWAGFLLTCVMTVLVGAFGGQIKAAGPASTLQDVLNEQQRSKGIMRAVGILVAVSTLPGLFAQRLESDASHYAASARELNKVLIKTTETLYETTKLKEAQQALNDLEEARESQ
jgi:hypothetical protein